MSMQLFKSISSETWSDLEKIATVIALLSGAWAVIKWRPIYNLLEEYITTSLSFDGRVDYVLCDNGRYLLRIIGVITNKKDHSVTVNKLTIDENTIPWSIPEEFRVMPTRGKASDSFIIKANDFKPILAGSMVPLSSSKSIPVYNFGHLEVWTSTDRKPGKSITAKLHTSRRAYKFKITDVREVSSFTPLPSGFYPIHMHTISLGSIHD